MPTKSARLSVLWVAPVSLEAAVAADGRGDFLSAAAAYEPTVERGDAPLGLLLDVALLYWNATDPGVAAHHRLTAEFMAIAWKRCRQLLAQAQQRFPASTEARFWARYIAWLDPGVPFSADECRRLLDEDKQTLVPALGLFMWSRGREAADEALGLLRRFENEGTSRARYIVSVVKSTQLHAGWNV